VTVVNKSNKPVDLGLTYISVQSRNQEADHVFDSPTGLNGPPNTKVSKGEESQFQVGFGVADAKDLVMEVALHDNSERPGLLYSTYLRRGWPRRDSSYRSVRAAHMATGGQTALT
jgi:hypothetical protein